MSLTTKLGVEKKKQMEFHDYSDYPMYPLYETLKATSDKKAFMKLLKKQKPEDFQSILYSSMAIIHLADAIVKGSVAFSILGEEAVGQLGYFRREYLKHNHTVVRDVFGRALAVTNKYIVPLSMKAKQNIVFYAFYLFKNPSFCMKKQTVETLEHLFFGMQRHLQGVKK